MRIIAGRLGGRRLRAPAGQATRPTSDRVRQALFNILGPPPPETWVLDLCAGAGALALEALSRGAAGAVVVDSGHAAVRAIQGNVADLGLGAQVRVVQADAIAALDRLPATPRFGWVFADPPYRSELAIRLLEALAGRTLLSEEAVVVVEHDRRQAPLDRHGSLLRTDRRRYGDTELSFYRAERAPPAPSTPPPGPSESSDP